ncbi:MAG: phosphotransferase [Chloroflexi bacterium]|nr:phosphotransferase [Chloroflexota bacterium]
MNKGPRLAEGRAAELFAWGDDQVIKLFRNPHWQAAEQEAQIARLAYANGVRTPHVYDIIESEGRPGIVYERIQGVSLLTVLATQLWRIWPLARAFAELHAAVHQVSLPELRRSRTVLQTDIQQAPGLPVDLQQATLRLLEQLPDADKLCHADFHPDNVIVAPDGLVVVDWANTVSGHPLADVAKTSLLLQFGQLPPRVPLVKRWGMEIFRTLLRSTYLNRYFQINALSRQQLPLWMAPVAAARMSEQIPGEQAPLTKFIKTQLNKKDFLHAYRQSA